MNHAKVFFALVPVLLATVSLAPRHSHLGGKTMLFTKKELRAQGIELLGPGDVGSDELLQTLIKTKSGIDLESSAPLTVFVVNKSAKTIKAISLSFNLTLADGSEFKENCGMIPLPQDLTEGSANDRALGISPGKTRAFSILPGLKDDGVQDSRLARLDRITKGHYERNVNRLLSANKLDVMIDGALFDDGEFIGQNPDHFREKLFAQARAWRDLHIQAADVLDRGGRDGWSKLQVFLRKASEGPKGKIARDATENDYYAFFRHMYARQTALVAQHVSDESGFCSWIKKEADKRELILPFKRSG
jgi:hypothetical protein